MARVVLDANVVVSSAFGGTPLKALVKAFRHTVIISPSIREELLALPEELASKLMPDHMVKLRRWLKMLILKSEIVHPIQEICLCRDPKDNVYLSLCHAGEVDYLVTGDKDLLSIGDKELASVGLKRLSIVTPRKFLSFRT